MSTNYKNKKLRVAIYCLISILALSNITVSIASATDDDYFTVEGSTLTLDELGPDDDRIVTVTLRAAREMDLSNINGSFTPTNEDDAELELVPIWGIKSHGMWMHCSWTENGSFAWNTEECHSEYHGYEEDLHLQAGDPIFEANYTVKPDVLLARRNLPVTINAALIKDEGEKTVSAITLNAEVFVYPAEDYHTINIYKEGYGDVIAPTVVLPNENVEISIAPDENNELLYFEVNGQDLTSQVVNDKIRMKSVLVSSARRIRFLLFNTRGMFIFYYFSIFPDSLHGNGR